MRLGLGVNVQACVPSKQVQTTLVSQTTMVVNRKQPVAPVPLVQSRSTSQQHLVTRKKHSKHTANGIDVRYLVLQHLFFVLNNVTVS